MFTFGLDRRKVLRLWYGVLTKVLFYFRFETEVSCSNATRPSSLHIVHDDQIHGPHQQRRRRKVAHPRRHQHDQESRQKEGNE